MKKILVVDDSSVQRKMIIQIIRKAGFQNEMLEAGDGLEAIGVLGENFQDIGIVLCDWNMPNMTGLELLKTVRSDPKFKHLPFLMVTAEAEKENIIEAVKCGVSNYVVKPFTGVTLQEKITKIYAGLKKAS